MTKPNPKAVFKGTRALAEYLDPERHPLLPLIEWPAALHGLGDDVHIYIKMPPNLSMKHYGAWGMWRKAAQDPNFKKKKMGWVPSSGNMGMVMGILARAVFGLKNFYAVVPADIAAGKLNLLQVTGSKTILDNALPDGHDGMSYAKEMGSKEDSIYFAQYSDSSNSEGYYPLFDQIWEQLDGELKGISFGCGTAGMGNGFKDCLEKKESKAITIAVHSSDEDQLPGMRSQERLKKVSLYDASRFDYTVEVSTYAGYRLSHQLCKHGLLLGPTSGATLHALLETLTNMKERNELAPGNYVAIGHDTSMVVLDKYTTQLTKDDFA